MKQAFINGFIKQATTYGLTKIEGEYITKTAGFHDWVHGMDKNLHQMGQGIKGLVGMDNQGPGYHPLDAMWNIGSGMVGQATLGQATLGGAKNLVNNNMMTHGLTAAIKSPFNDKSFMENYHASAADSANSRAQGALNDYKKYTADNHWNPDLTQQAQKEMDFQTHRLANHGALDQAEYFKNSDTETLMPQMQAHNDNAAALAASNKERMGAIGGWHAGQAPAPIAKPIMPAPRPLTPQQLPTVQGFSASSNPINIQRPIIPQQTQLAPHMGR